MNLLLTGFGPFGEVTTNPAQCIVETLAADPPRNDALRLHTAILPVAYDAAGERLRALIEVVRPDVILMLGVAGRRTDIALERIALNLDDSPTRPDNAGRAPDGAAIEPGAPLALASTLPLSELRDVFRAAGVPVAISNHAGAYLCNHAFYVGLRTVERLALPARCGFIHVPMPRELSTDGAVDAPALADLVAAIRRCIIVLARP